MNCGTRSFWVRFKNIESRPMQSQRCSQGELSVKSSLVRPWWKFYSICLRVVHLLCSRFRREGWGLRFYNRSFERTPFSWLRFNLPLDTLICSVMNGLNRNKPCVFRIRTPQSSFLKISFNFQANFHNMEIYWISINSLANNQYTSIQKHFKDDIWRL